MLFAENQLASKFNRMQKRKYESQLSPMSVFKKNSMHYFEVEAMTS